ncbi:MAG: helix-turn-helix transcriptional regulator [Steroidobacteraceae bacterium]
MTRSTSESHRLLKPFEIGKLVAAGRRRAKLSQQAFAERLGVSRKTVSDLERGAAENVSLKTAMAAISQAGYVLAASARRAPSLAEVMAQRAAHRTRVEELAAAPTAPPRKPGG